jgi:flavin-dependent dehydrogenase
MPAGVAALRFMGVDLSEHSCAPFRGIKFVNHNGEVSATFPRGAAYGVRRTTLHQTLAGHARECGAELRWGMKVTGLLPQGVLVEGREIAARYVVIADGQKSPLRQMAGLCVAKTKSKRFGFRQHYRIRPWSDLVEVHWSDVGQMYVTPVSDNEVGIALLTSGKAIIFENALSHFPQVEAKVRDCEPSSRLMGGVTVTRYVRAVVRGNVALVGDASGCADAITGDGLSLAFRQAVALANAICKDDLMRYQYEHRRIARRPLAMGRLLLLMNHNPRLRDVVFQTLRANPWLFEALLRFHVGDDKVIAPQVETSEVAV